MCGLLGVYISSVDCCRFGTDVAKSGFEFLTEMTMYTAKSGNPEIVAKSKLLRFLEVTYIFVLTA